MPSNWITRVFKNEGVEHEITFKMPGRKFAKEISCSAIKVRRELEQKYGNPYLDKDGNTLPKEDVDGDALAKYMDMEDDRHFWIAENVKIKLATEWEGVEHTPGEVIDSEAQEIWCDEYYIYAKEIGKIVETYVQYGVPSYDPDRILSIDDYERLMTQAVLTAKSPSELKERLDMLNESMRKMVDNAAVKMKEVKTAAEDTAENPTLVKA